MLNHPRSHELVAALRRSFGPRWEVTVTGSQISVVHGDRGSPYRPPHRTTSWRELLNGLGDGFRSQGIPRDDCLPLRWARDTELTISAVQALDPLLKDGRQTTYRQGYIPQPVVRLTGKRGNDGELLDGWLTSFVNVSCVRPIADVNDYAATFDAWLSVLSRLRLHARHVSLHGDVSAWNRREVDGITLRFRHLDRTFGDIALLWNHNDQDRMVVDLGTGLEQLAWVRTELNWTRLIYGQLADAASPRTLDALRAATLLIGNGIHPRPRGAGSITRRVLSSVVPTEAVLGVGSAVSTFHGYWSDVAPLKTPWTNVAAKIEYECQRNRTSRRQERPVRLVMSDHAIKEVG